jgi:hypothetical protein
MERSNASSNTRGNQFACMADTLFFARVARTQRKPILCQTKLLLVDYSRLCKSNSPPGNSEFHPYSIRSFKESTATVGKHTASTPSAWNDVRSAKEDVFATTGSGKTNAYNVAPITSVNTDLEKGDVSFAAVSLFVSTTKREHVANSVTVLGSVNTGRTKQNAFLAKEVQFAHVERASKRRTDCARIVSNARAMVALERFLESLLTMCVTRVDASIKGRHHKRRNKT